MAGVRGEIDRGAAEAVASMMVATGRVPHPAQWVASMKERAEADALESLV